jgi:hypothetical protein
MPSDLPLTPTKRLSSLPSGVISRHKDWHAVDDLPGVRIVRRYVKEGCFEFIDERGVSLATQEQGRISTDGDEFVVTEQGLKQIGLEIVVIPSPNRSHRGQATREVFRGSHRSRIGLSDGSAMDLWVKTDFWSRRWNLARLVSESGVLLITLRWTPEADGHRLLGYREGTPKFKRVGQAIIAPGKALPVNTVLLVAYAFNIVGLY